MWRSVGLPSSVLAGGLPLAGEFSERIRMTTAIGDAVDTASPTGCSLSMMK